MPWIDDKVQQMREMGFTDDGASRIALSQTGGNIADAIEKLVRRTTTAEHDPLEDRNSQQAGSEKKDSETGDGPKALAPIFRASQNPSSSQAWSQTPQKSTVVPSRKSNQKTSVAPFRSAKSAVKSESLSSINTMSTFASSQAAERQLTQSSGPDASTHPRETPTNQPPILLQDDDSPVNRPPAKKRKVSGAAPLSERMRPAMWSSVVGQERVAAMLRGFAQQARVPSMILWGPPGCGKTTLGRMLAELRGHVFVSVSAVNAGVAEVKKVVQEAQAARSLQQKQTLLFLDEIHRFNKAQQDALLPHVESGLLTLVGATTENPSFALNRALLSRAKVFVLEKLSQAALLDVLRRALADQEHGAVRALHAHRASTAEGEVEVEVEVGEEVLEAIAGMADGDARVALNTLELSVLHAAQHRADATHDDGEETRCEEESQESVVRSPAADTERERSEDLDTPPGFSARSSSGEERGGGGRRVRVVLEDVREAVARTHVGYDAGGDEHYTIISAFHKSIRGGDAQAAVYWLARMLCGGEKPEYVARRMIRIASEDVGLGDPGALGQAVAAQQACQAVGMPECNLALTQCAVYLALAPKCTAIYQGWAAAERCVRSQPLFPVPLHLRNANSKVLSDLGWGVGYKYNPDYPDGAPEQTYLPPELQGQSFVPLPARGPRGHSPAL